MKTLIILMLATILVGCTPTTTKMNDSYVLPDGMEDCSIYRMESSRGNSITAIKCPNSTVNVRNHGKKSNKDVSVVETRNDSLINRINQLQNELVEIKSALKK